MRSEEYKEVASSARLSDIEYQPFKLTKLFKKRTVNNNYIEILHSVIGLECISPETFIKSNLILQLLSPHTEDLCISSRTITNCELLILAAMNKEPSSLIARTLKAINENLEYFNQAGIDPTKVACVVIID